MDKVRLDFYLGSKGKLSIGDKVVNNHGLEQIIYDDEWADDFNERNDRDNEVFITSFTDRENKGVQPVPDGFPVVVTYRDSHFPESCLADDVSWNFSFTWKPDYDKLLEMQKEHDAKQELSGGMKKIRSFALESDADIEELMINAKESKMSNVFTQEMKSAGVTPPIGMEVKVLNKEGFEIEYGKHLIGQTVKVLSESLLASGGVSVQAIEFDGNCYCFRSSMLHPAKSKEELELEGAKANQVKEVSQFLRELAKSTGFNDAAKALQEKGMLAEIVLPLEDK